MRRVFNLGIGMVLIVPADERKPEKPPNAFLEAAKEPPRILGRIIEAHSEEENQKVIFTF